ncbi:PQQ-binding-like beta-propeller repeat protein [Pleomorphovibrio marinus]|uniref:PQQ-binding-like beta-propeller repeat protein n=1 Tax=Pleomorphovibrio marinus TaxID=2164132 RepID=UPI000E0C87BA|nr:PQQ-binding-like beta-propeller repeat protein [Pleomorphovibrio marinus]
MSRFYLISLVAVWVFSCKQKKESDLVWDVNFSQIGSQSSPRSVDLNGDGILDFVMGAGKNEFQESDMGILAIDGSDGELLWAHPSEDQVYGAPVFQDINDDGVPDIFIGGRSPYFKAIDGKTGNLLWEYRYDYEDHPVLQYARFNFNTAVLVPDQNEDGIPDLLVSNGGNYEAQPYLTENRFPGVLMVFDAKTGNILAADTLPDGKETYMSPVAFQQPGEKATQVVFGSGGETIDGSLYVTKLEDLMNNDLSNSIPIARENGHGFIATPVIADINQDGMYDIIAISHASTAVAIDGNTLKPIWENQVPGTECSNSFAVGQFTDDDTPDFFTFVSQGVWPENTGSVQVLFDGSTGEIVFTDSLGCTGFSSPVAYDLNNDGIEEAIISINEFDCNRFIGDQSSFAVENRLLVIDFKTGSHYSIDQTKGFKNIFSTPWIGDIDGDGFLDLVHCQYYSHSDLLSFLGMRVKRIDLPIKVRKTPVWGAYMGSNNDAIYPIR